MNARFERADAAPPASMGRRFAAVLLDVLVWVAVGGWLVAVGVVGWARAEPSSPAAASALSLITIGLALTGALVLTQWLLHGLRGWTVGRRMTGIRTVDVETRQPVGVARIFVRTAVIAAGAVVLLVGAVVVLVSPFFDRTRRHRGWHDRAAGDEVLDVRRSVHSAVERPSRSIGPAAATRPTSSTRSPAPVPEWGATSQAATPRPPAAPRPPAQPRQPSTGSLVLAPIAPRRSSPDLDTRTIPVVQAGAVGLLPELELTRPAGQRADLVVEPPAVQERPAAEFELSDGRRVSIERTALVGRNPASDAAVQLVRVADPTRSVSKTHLQIGVEPAGVWVADRGSTNGTVVTLPDGGQVRCGVDQQVRIRVGSTVVFGDCSIRLLSLPEVGPTP